MDEFIPHSGHHSPGNLRIFLFSLSWYLLCCLPDNFKISNYRIYGFIILGKLIKMKALGILLYLFEGLEDIINIDSGVSFHR